MSSDEKQTLPPQVQDQQPGHETEMNPRPDYEPRYPGSNRLQGKVALITGGDSGIGRATAVLFAREGADLAIMYLNESEDAQETKRLVEREGRSCLTIAGDVGDPGFCRSAVDQVIQRFGKLDVLVNNAAEQHPKKAIEVITPDQIDRTFRTNIFGYFYMVQAAMPHLKKGGRHHQHHVGDSLPRQLGSARLQRHQRGHRGFHAVIGAEARRRGHSCEWRGAGTDLDAADPFDLPGREGEAVRRQHAHEAPWPAERGGAVIPVPGVRGFLLHHRLGPASERRRSH